MYTIRCILKACTTFIKRLELQHFICSLVHMLRNANYLPITHNFPVSEMPYKARRSTHRGEFVWCRSGGDNYIQQNKDIPLSSAADVSAPRNQSITLEANNCRSQRRFICTEVKPKLFHMKPEVK